MIAGQRIIGIITARGGSKGISQKNLATLQGKPLIAWTIEAGQSSGYLDRLIVSTDDDAIVEAAKSLGCEVPFRRDSRLAQDETPSIEVVIDALEQCPGYDFVVLLQPTSPFRTAEDIDMALEFCIKHSAPACVSVSRAEKSPEWMYRIDDNAHLSSVLVAEDLPSRRQDLQTVFTLNGSIYVANVDWLRAAQTFIGPDTVAYETPIDRSVDIDTDRDLEYAEFLLA